MTRESSFFMISVFPEEALGDTRGDLIEGTEIESALPAWIRVGLRQEETIKLKLRLYPGVLECLSADSHAGHALKLAYPVPAPIRLSFPDRPDEPYRWERLWPGRLLRVPDTGPIVLQTLTGERYRLKTRGEYYPGEKIHARRPLESCSLPTLQKMKQ
jgi:hypothetical protein